MPDSPSGWPTAAGAEGGGTRVTGGPRRLEETLAELAAVVAAARPLPLSGLCRLDRTALRELVAEAAQQLPVELHQARWILADRDQVVDEGRRAAARIVEAARAERARLVDRTEVAAEAERTADRLLREAHARATTLRGDVDDYVDGRLAYLEVALRRTLGAVEQGRGQLAGHDDLAALRAESRLPR